VHPVFPAPSDLEGKGNFQQSSGAARREIAKLCPHSSLRGALLSAEARLRVKADATKQSTLSLRHRYAARWIASLTLAMTALTEAGLAV
jgi:hypothetical protein